MKDGAKVQIDDLIDLLVRKFMEAIVVRHAGIVDQHIHLEPVEGLAASFHVGDIEGVRDASGACAEFLETIAAPRNGVNFQTSCGELLNRGPSNAAGSSGDHGGFVRQGIGTGQNGLSIY
jgi:hypothetical protein